MDAGTVLLIVIAVIAVGVLVARLVTNTPASPPMTPPPAAQPIQPTAHAAKPRKAKVKEVVHGTMLATPVPMAIESPAQRGRSRGKATVVAVSTQKSGICMVCGSVGCTKH